MASDEHKRLADFIKSTHNQLRKESRLYGPLKAWERHLARTEILKNYAATMRELATNHWNERIAEKDEGTQCRNKWISSRCYDYFFNGGMEKFDAREKDIRNKMSDSGHSVVSTERIDGEKIANDSGEAGERRIKLLDVGSCYNPLGSEVMFDVTPIDIAPSSENVFQCDFLNVQVGSETILSGDKKSLEKLKESSFDAVVFSLLLEYFPCPEQRFECCKKAYSLLRQGGILIVITPDSNHVGSNASIMKSWRFVLSRFGYMRIAYEKLRHLSCLIFRKCADRAVASRWSEIQTNYENIKFPISDDKIYIPQDFSTFVEPEESRAKVVYDSEELVSVFNEMPCSGDAFE